MSWRQALLVTAGLLRRTQADWPPLSPDPPKVPPCDQERISINNTDMALEFVNKCAVTKDNITTLHNSLALHYDISDPIYLGNIDTLNGSLDLSIFPCVVEPGQSPSPGTPGCDGPGQTTIPSGLQVIAGDLNVRVEESSADPISVNLDFSLLSSIANFRLDGPFNQFEATFSPEVKVDGRVSVLQIGSGVKLPLMMAGEIFITPPGPIPTNNSGVVVSSSVSVVENILGACGNPSLETISFPGLEYVHLVAITGNPILKNMDVAAATVDYLSVSNNGPELSVSLPRLQILQGKYGALTRPICVQFPQNVGHFEGVSKLSVPVLEKATSLNISSNPLDSLRLPALVSINRSLIITNNSALRILELRRLKSIGSDLIINDVPQLFNVTANALTDLGSLHMSGDFTNVEFFSLGSVLGDFTITGAPSMDCSWFDDNVQKIVKGRYICVGNHTRPATPRRPSTSTLESKTYGSNGLSTGAKTGIAVGAAVGFGLAGVGLWVFYRRRRRLDTPAGPTPREVGKPELDGKDGQHLLKGELEATPASSQIAGELGTEQRNELPAERETRELPAQEPVGELPAEATGSRLQEGGFAEEVTVEERAGGIVAETQREKPL